MAANILDELLELFDKATVKNTADALGESREAIATAVRPAISAVTQAANECSATFDGAEHLLRTVSEFEGNLHKNYRLIVDSGSHADIIELGRRASAGILGGRKDVFADRLQDLSGLSPKGAQDFLNLTTALVIDLAGEERATNSLNRVGVTKYFEAQRTLLLAELPANMLTQVGLIEPELRELNEDHLGLNDFAPKSAEFTPPLQEVEVDFDDEQLPIVDDMGEIDELDQQVVTCVLDDEDEFATVDDDLGEIFVSVNEDGDQIVEESEDQFQLSPEEKRAFYFKAGLVLATLGTMWFYALSVVGKTASRPQATPLARQDAGGGDRIVVTEAKATRTVEPKVDSDKNDLLDHPLQAMLTTRELLPFDVTSIQDVSAGELPPKKAQSYSRLTRQAEWSKPSHSISLVLSDAASSAMSDSISRKQPTFNRFVSASYKQTQLFAVAKPIKVHFEAANPRIHPPEVRGFNVVGDLKIPVFHGPRYSGRSYFSR